jgi:hypothetical protein
MRTLRGIHASFSAEYADNLIRSGHVLTINTYWGYDYKDKHVMTVKGLVTMVAAPMFSARVLRRKESPCMWNGCQFCPINGGDPGRISKVIYCTGFGTDTGAGFGTDIGGAFGTDVGDQETAASEESQESDWVQAGAAHIYRLHGRKHGTN